MRLLKNRAFHVQIAEPLSAPEASAIHAALNNLHFDSEKIKVVMQHVAVTGGLVYAGKKLLDTTAEIAIIAAKAKFK